MPREKQKNFSNSDLPFGRWYLHNAEFWPAPSTKNNAILEICVFSLSMYSKEILEILCLNYLFIAFFLLKNNLKIKWLFKPFSRGNIFTRRPKECFCLYKPAVMKKRRKYI